jgi:SAM-dependent methyltransferase
MPDLDVQFTPIAHELRAAIIEHYAERREPLDHPEGLRTLDTNTTLVPARGDVLLRLLAERREAGAPAGLDVLDLGCGFGALSLYLALAGARVVGVDPNEERFAVAATVAAKFGLDVVFLRGRMEELRRPDMTFDVAVMNNSLCYVVGAADRQRAHGHVLRVLRPGGWLVIRDPARASLVDPFTNRPLLHQLPPGVTRRIGRLNGSHRSIVHLRTRVGAARELRAAGFADVHADHRRREGWHPRRYQHLTARRPPLSAL